MAADMARVALIQAGTELFNAKATLQKFKALAMKAAKGGAKLAVFPEAFLGGYPKGLDFGATLGIRTQEGREMFRRCFDDAAEIPGDLTREIGAIARKHKMAILTGLIEREGGTLYCSAVYFDAKGTLLHHHRKIVPTALERAVWGCGDGSSLTTVDTPEGKVGTLICWENYMPLARMALYQQGVELYCALTVDDREAWIPTLRHIAREGRCFVLSACQYLSKKNYPGDILKATRYLQDPPIRGGSCVVSPLGELIAGPLYDREGIVFADLDRNDIARGKYDLDVAGHYARPDIFKFRHPRS
jgi:nitrilase